MFVLTIFLIKFILVKYYIFVERGIYMKKKSKVKMIGLSTIVTSNDELTIASSAPRNTLCVEKKYKQVGKKLDELPTNKATIKYSVNLANKNEDQTKDDFNVSEVGKKSFGNTAILNSPNRIDKVGKDLIGMKDKLEQKYFGQIFPQDNLKIQIIYNMIDIRKIFAVYLNHIIVSLNNLSRDSTGYDSFGTFYWQTNYAEAQKPILDDPGKEPSRKKNLDKFEKTIDKIAKYTSFLNNIFVGDISTVRCRNTIDNSFSLQNVVTYKNEHNFNVYRLIGMSRQLTYHNFYKNGGKPFDDLFCLTKMFLRPDANNNSHLDLVNFLQQLWNKQVEKLNQNFVINSYDNIDKLCNIYSINSPEQKNELIVNYYNYITYHDDKNLGINLKALRENYIDKAFPKLKDKTYDGKRKKIYKMLNFVMYQSLTRSASGMFFVNMLVDKLRATENDLAKENIYSEEDTLVQLGRLISQNIANGNKKSNGANQNSTSSIDIAISQIASKVSQQNVDVDINSKYINLEIGKKIFKNCVCSLDYNKKIGKIDALAENKPSIDLNIIKSLSPHISTNFALLINFLTSFLEYKELNDFLTTMISKFQNIGALLQLDKVCGTDYDAFRNLYGDVLDAKKIASELELVKSIGVKKVLTEINTSTDSIFNDACQCFGFKAQSIAGNKGITNFIKNNVVKSKRFIYVERYCGPTNITQFYKNYSNVAKFILNSIEEKQIDRYYLSIEPQCSDLNIVSKQQKIDSLFDVISQLAMSNGLFGDITWNNSFGKSKYSNFGKPDNAQFEKLKEQKKQNKAKIERIKSTTRLYLTIYYLFIKNMVNINSRYTIAWNNLEGILVLNGNKLSGLTSTKLVRDAIQNKKINAKNIGKVSQCLAELENMFGANISFFVDYRNYIDHINIVNQFNKYCDNYKLLKFETYYDIFHFIIQVNLLNYYVYEKKFNNSAEFNNRIVSDSHLSPAQIEIRRLQCEASRQKSLSIFNDYLSKLKAYGSYNTDFTKIFNVVFAYNFPRYANLTSSLLFDKNNSQNRQ